MLGEAKHSARPPDLLPDLLPKYMVIVGARWYLLGLAAALEYQRVPTSPNSHKVNVSGSGVRRPGRLT